MIKILSLGQPARHAAAWQPLDNGFLKDGKITSVSGASSFSQRIYLHAKNTTDHSYPYAVQMALERVTFVWQHYSCRQAHDVKCDVGLPKNGATEIPRGVEKINDCLQ